MIEHRTTFGHRALLMAGAGLCLMGLAGPATAAARSQLAEAWPGRRVVLVLPLTLGAGWNADRAAGESLLPVAYDALTQALEDTGKLSVLQAYRFNSILVRAAEDKVVSPTDFETLLTAPTPDAARVVLAHIPFALPPLIAEFHLEELRPGGTQQHPLLQVQVSCRLYDADNAEALRSEIVTSHSVSGGHSEKERVVMGAADAFRQISHDIVQPVADLTLARPRSVAPGAPALKPAPLTVGVATPSSSAGATVPAAAPATGMAPPTQPLQPSVPIAPAAPSAPDTGVQPAAPGAVPPVMPVAPAAGAATTNPTAFEPRVPLQGARAGLSRSNAPA